MSTFVCVDYIDKSWDIKKLTNNQDSLQWNFLVEKATRKLIEHFSY